MNELTMRTQMRMVRICMTLIAAQISKVWQSLPSVHVPSALHWVASEHMPVSLTLADTSANVAWVPSGFARQHVGSDAQPGTSGSFKQLGASQRAENTE